MTTTLGKAFMHKAVPSPTHREVADETARRLRTAAKPGDPKARIRGNLPDLMEFIGSRREVTLATMNKPRLRGNNNGGFDGYSGDTVLDEKAARIARLALESDSPAERTESAEWVRKFVKGNMRAAAITAAGRFLARA